MIAEQHPFIRKLAAANACFDDRVGLHAGVHVHFHVSFHRAGEAIRDGQSALPIFRGFRTIHVLEKRFGIAPRKRERRNLRQRARFFRRDVLCAGDGSPTGSRGITRNNVIVGYRAALNVTLRAPRAIGENFAMCVAVVGRIGINEQGSRVFPFRGERLEAAITVGIRIADENDFALYADAIFPKQIVILRIAAVRVDNFGGDVAGCGIAKVGAGDSGIFRVGISVVSIFPQRRGELDRRGHFEGDAARARVQNIVAAQRDVFPSLLAPFASDEVSKLVIAIGSRGMRFGGEGAVPFARFFGRRNGLERGFELVFGGGMPRGKTENRSGGRSVLLELSRKREG